MDTKKPVTRRDFLRETTLVGTTAVAASVLANGLVRPTVTSAAPLLADQFDKEADIVVAGAGIAGLSAALKATQDGAKVILFEASKEVGGTATLAGGSIDIPSFPDSLEKLRKVMPGVDGALGNAYLAAHKEWIDWLIKMGTPLAIVANVSITLGGSYKKNLASLNLLANKFKDAGGQLFFGLMAQRLLIDATGNVVGIRAHRQGRQSRHQSQSGDSRLWQFSQ